MIINTLYIINNDVDAHAPNPQGGTLWKYSKLSVGMMKYWEIIRKKL